jgi:hypothetical protein
MPASAIIPPRHGESRGTPLGVSPETQDAARVAVRDLLSESRAFEALGDVKRRELANNLVQIGAYLAEPDGVRVPARHQAPAVRSLASSSASAGQNTDQEGKFTAQGAREGAAVAGALLSAVNFPDFVAGLIKGVFHSIVQSSMEQMEAYGKLVADVAKSLNQFRDENVSPNQGRDQLVDQFPDLFQLSMDTGDFGNFGDSAPAGPRVVMKDGVDEKSALDRVNSTLPIDGGPLSSLDDDTIESKLVPAAQTQVASSRQQLLATMVMMGINRIVVTDGKISAKVLYDFKAQDNMKYRRSAQSFDYGDQYATTGEGTYEGSSQSSSQDASTSQSGNTGASRDASYYSKGTYKTTAQPVLTAASASQTSIDASLDTKASLAGVVEVNFKSDYLPLEKMATPENIAAIQMNAQPGMVKNVAARPRTGAATPAATPAPATAPAPAA